MTLSSASAYDDKRSTLRVINFACVITSKHTRAHTHIHTHMGSLLNHDDEVVLYACLVFGCRNILCGASTIIAILRPTRLYTSKYITLYTLYNREWRWPNGGPNWVGFKSMGGDLVRETHQPLTSVWYVFVCVRRSIWTKAEQTHFFHTPFNIYNQYIRRRRRNSFGRGTHDWHIYVIIAIPINQLNAIAEINNLQATARIRFCALSWRPPPKTKRPTRRKIYANERV